MSTNHMAAVLVQNQQQKKIFSSLESINFIDVENIDLNQTKNLFILTSASTLKDVSSIVKQANNTHDLKALFIYEDIDSKWLPQIFDQANLRVMRNTFIHNDLDLPQRVLNAWNMKAQDDLIATAIAFEDYLLVFSCAMEQFKIDFQSLPALKKIPVADRNSFEVDVDGSYLYWPTVDIHLDLDSFRYVVDPEYQQRVKLFRLSHDQAFGQAIAKLRKQYKLRQADIKGISARQVSRIENGEKTTLETLKILAIAHNLDINEYLNQVAEKINHNSLTLSSEKDNPHEKKDLRELMGTMHSSPAKYRRFNREHQS